MYQGTLSNNGIQASELLCALEPWHLRNFRCLEFRGAGGVISLRVYSLMLLYARKTTGTIGACMIRTGLYAT